MTHPITFLVDNGSLAPAATLRLRELARQLTDRINQAVVPVSLLHASAVAADRLGGEPAEIVEPALARRAADGARDIIILPLFFGPSRALTEYLPARVAHLRARCPDLRVRVAPTLFDEPDDRLARILADHVRATSGAERVVLVDHGSPAPVVTEVRNRLAAQLAAQLGRERRVTAASMERREGAEYDFCEPLLERQLREPGWNDGELVIAMQFLLPGRHAGPDGDVAEICQQAEAENPGQRTRMTPLVGEHPLLIDILADRWRAVGA